MDSFEYYEEIMSMIKDCERLESRLTESQRSFIDSISRRLENGLNLTRPQLMTLDAVWESVTSNRWG